MPHDTHSCYFPMILYEASAIWMMVRRFLNVVLEWFHDSLIINRFKVNLWQRESPCCTSVLIREYCFLDCWRHRLHIEFRNQPVQSACLPMIHWASSHKHAHLMVYERTGNPLHIKHTMPSSFRMDMLRLANDIGNDEMRMRYLDSTLYTSDLEQWFWG